jgi:hypothetical protein
VNQLNLDELVREIAIDDWRLHSLVENATPEAIRSARIQWFASLLSLLLVLVGSALLLSQSARANLGGATAYWWIIGMTVVVAPAATGFAVGHSVGHLRALRLARAIRQRLRPTDLQHAGDRRRITI